MKTKLPQVVQDILNEAARRYLMFSPQNKSLTEAWTGLGSAAEYRPAVQAGFMVQVFPRSDVNPRHDQWWRLTESGAAIVEEIMTPDFCEQYEPMSHYRR